LAALIRGLTATRSYYDVLRKETLTEQDFKTQVQSAEILWAYDVGKPVERREVITRSFEGLEALEDRIKKSPELRRTMRLMLDNAEKVVEPAKEA
jgi:hypothetical protein